MKVSLSWLVIFILIVFIAYFFWKGCLLYESFLVKEEPFIGGVYSTNDISIRTCPSNTKSFINSQGFTLCCEGTLSGSTCKGTEVCSLSGNSLGLPTCSVYYGSYLEQKGALRCPPSMPNYYESADGSISGCTSGKRTPTGTSPASPADKQCKLYTKEEDEMGSADSCTNIKLLETTNCFSAGTQNSSKSLLQFWPTPIVQCSYTDARIDPTPHTCMEQSSLLRYFQYLSKLYPEWSSWYNSWTQNSASWDPMYKIRFCSVMEKYVVNKTITFNDLPKISVF